jgi:hypothetical protein
MSVFGENSIGGRVSLDIAGSYPTGLMAALGNSYNDPQETINAQLRYTAAQVDLNAQYDAGYAEQNLQIERTATLAANNLATQLAATTYKNASHQVNYANQNLSNTANTAYNNAYSIYKICRDASYLAYLASEASEIIDDKAAAKRIVASIGKSKPDVNLIDITTLSTVSTSVEAYNRDANDAIIVAQNNAQQYVLKTQTILGSAIKRSTKVTLNLTIVSALNSLLKDVLKNIADPLNNIAGKETLVTQYVPSIPLNNAIQVANYAINTVKGCLSALSSNIRTNSEITTNVASALAFANSLDTIARGEDNKMYLAEVTAKQMFQTASTMKSLGSVISIPNEFPYNPYYVSKPSINVANAAKKVANAADLSAVNARTVSKALILLQELFLSNNTPEPIIAITISNALKTLNEMMASVNKVTSNTSAYTGVAVSIRSSNTVNNILSQKSIQEADSISASTDAQSVLDLLRYALSKTVVTNLKSIRDIPWVVNAATGRAEEVAEKAKERSLILSRTAHNLVSPQTIAIQTASANTAGALNNNRLSRLDRNSRNAPSNPPSAYNPFRADIRAKTLQPIRPSLDELVYKNRLAPLRLDSLRTITANKIKVAQDVQHINDISAFSFRQQ